jgi:hypothetical protein
MFLPMTSMALIKGDLLGTGTVSISDALLALKISVGLDQATPYELSVGDFYGTGSITVSDALLILKEVVGLGPTVSGTASQGTALPSGTVVTLTDATGITATTTVGTNGTFTFQVTGLKAPYLLNAGSYYSLALASGTTDINPLTNLVMQAALGTSTITSSTVLPAGFQTTFTNTANQLKTALSGLYPSSVPLTQTDFLNGNISIGSGVDLVFASTIISPPNSSGNFSITVSGQPIITGNTSSGNVTLTPNNSAISSAGNTLYPDITVSGQVTLNGAGLSGVSVTLTGTGSSTVQSNSSGSFTFTYVQNGSYTLSALMAGYTMSASQQVTVSGTNVSGITFTATAASTPSSNVFTTAMISGKTFIIALSNGQTNIGICNPNGTVENSSATWSINSSGQLVVQGYASSNNPNDVGTFTLNSISGSVIYFTVVQTGASDPSEDISMTGTATPLSSIAVTPANSSLSVGATQQFTATGTFADGSTQDLTSLVTWSLTNISYATIASGGLATGIAAGSSTITATSGSIAGSTALKVAVVNNGTGIIITVAGNGTGGYSGDNGAATSGGLYYPTGVAVDRAGNTYIADTNDNRIRKVTAGTGIITTVAGNGAPGYSGDNGAATSASLNYPYGIAVDSAGNIYIADSLNNRIRKVAAGTGIITTVAGNGTGGYSGDNGAATSASLNMPVGVAVDSAGNIYIADE